MAKGLYLQRGLKREQKSHRKIILLLALFLALGVIIAPLLWKTSRSKHISEKNAVSKIPSSTETGARSDVVVGKIPKTQPVPVSQIVQEQPPSTSEQPLKVAGGSTPEGLSQNAPSSSGLVGSPISQSQSPPTKQLVGKTENIYELRSEIRQKEIAEDKKAKETVAQSALSEMPFPSGTTESSGTSSDTGKVVGKHTITSMLEPEKKSVKKESPGTSPEKTPTRSNVTSKTKTQTPKPQTETASPLSAPKVQEPKSSSDRGESYNYWIQVGVYREEANAKKVKAIIDGLGYETVVRQSSHPKLGMIYIVRVPVKGSKDEAQRLISTISQKTGDRPVLIESR